MSYFPEFTKLGEVYRNTGNLSEAQATQSQNLLKNIMWQQFVVSGALKAIERRDRLLEVMYQLTHQQDVKPSDEYSGEIRAFQALRVRIEPELTKELAILGQNLVSEVKDVIELFQKQMLEFYSTELSYL